MQYRSEPIDTNFGKGVRIEKDEKSYEQITCRDGLYARIFKAPYYKEGQSIYTGYRGIIVRQLFDDTEADYEQFKILAERLQQVSGEEIPNTKANFMDYIARKGLEKKLPRIDSIIGINLKNEKVRLDKTTLSWLNRKSYLGGAITSLAGYAGGFAVMANISLDAYLERNLAMYAVIAPMFEGIFGLGVELSSEKFWCGPLHAPGFIISRIIHGNKLRDPNYMLNKFLQNYQRLEEMCSSVGNQRKFAKQSKLADRHFEIIEYLFPLTQHQKGFSITYNGQNREDVVNFFSYVLNGGNALQMPNPQARVSKPIQEEKVEIEVPHQKIDFVNPWEIEIPKIGGKKNE